MSKKRNRIPKGFRVAMYIEGGHSQYVLINVHAQTGWHILFRFPSERDVQRLRNPRNGWGLRGSHFQMYYVKQPKHGCVYIVE